MQNHIMERGGVRKSRLPHRSKVTGPVGHIATIGVNGDPSSARTVYV